MKLGTYALFSLLVVMVSTRPTETSEEERTTTFQPETKTATIVELEELRDPHFIFPVLPDIDEKSDDTYFVFYEYHAKQLVKNTLLKCSDNKPGGTHPTPIQACEEILELDGDCDSLMPDSNLPPHLCLCPTVYDPVIVNVQGKYKGAEFSFLKEFGNPCEFKCVTEPLEHFFGVGLNFK